MGISDGQPQDGEGAGPRRRRPGPPLRWSGCVIRSIRASGCSTRRSSLWKPAEDDAVVYGAAWPLVEEWRRLRVDHPNRGKSLLWLTTEERLLVLELAMLEEQGLTLPPEKQPLRGFGRKGQTTHRWKALSDTRRALRRWKLLRWIAPWRWLEKALEPSPGPVPGGC